jgi:hypothetical protein
MQDKPSQVQVEAASDTSAKDGMDGISKHNTVNGDVGLKIFAGRHVPAAAIDPKAEARLVRKIDMHIIPFICITYLITYIDKATLSYGLTPYFIEEVMQTNTSLAAIFGLSKDIGLHGTQYSWLGAIFYFGYMFVSLSLCYMSSCYC